jgi:hypothetical protein
MSWRDLLKRWRRTANQFLLGAALTWTLVPYQIQYRHEMEHIFGLILNSQAVGLPMLPPRSRLRLLPYFVPNLLYWKRMTIFDQALEGADLRHIGH